MLKIKNIIKYFLFLVIMAGAFTVILPAESFADDACAAALTAPEEAIADTIQDPGMFSKEILDNMHDAMLKIYVSLSMLFMLGHGMMCYASEALFTCGGLDFGDKSVCIFRIPHLSFYITGLVVYITAFFMTMSVGMYFLDISFKLGFAVLFLPVTIGLWPFAPTKNKFTDNLSIIISNALLFAFLSIGVAYAVILIREGIIGDKEGWMKFWEAIDLTINISGNREVNTLDGGDNILDLFSFAFGSSLDSATQTKIDNSTEYMVSTFSLDGTKILVILFCLVFGFKILASSVTDYLNTFCGDAVFGGSSPMHHMGTQAVGFVKSHTVDPAVSLVKDVAATQTGRALEGMGKGLNRMAHGDFRDPKKIAHAVFHPRETFNKAAKKVGNKANQAVHSLGNAATEIYDTMQILKPGEYSESRRQQNTEKFAARMNTLTDTVGKSTENVIAHGGGKIKNVLAHPATTLQKTGVLANKLTQNSGTLLKQAHTVMLNAKNMPPAERAKKIAAFNRKVDKVTKTIGGGAEKAGYFVKGVSTKTKTAAHAFVDKVGNEVKSGTVKATTATINAFTPAGKKLNEKQVQSKLFDLNDKIKHAPSAAKSGIVNAEHTVNNFTRPTANSLTAGNVLKGSANAIAHPQQTYRTIKKLAQQEISQIQKQKGVAAKGKIILKRSGQVVLRSVRGTAQETASGVAEVTGNVLENIGRSMQKHKRDPNKKSSWSHQQEEEAEAEDERLRNQTIDVD